MTLHESIRIASVFFYYKKTRPAPVRIASVFYFLNNKLRLLPLLCSWSEHFVAFLPFYVF